MFPSFFPKIPFVTPIPGGLQHGMMVRIIGEMTRSDRFVIKIQNGPKIDPSDDQLLHLSIRPSDNVIIRNHLKHHNWGAEERFGGCPIRVGKMFTIIILAENDYYKIAVNGTHFCDFRHRIPLSKADHLCISGSVRVNAITLEYDVAPVLVPPQHPSIPQAISFQPHHQSGYQPPLPTPIAPQIYQPPDFQPPEQHTQSIYPRLHDSMSSSTHTTQYQQSSYYSTTYPKRDFH